MGSNVVSFTEGQCFQEGCDSTTLGSDYFTDGENTEEDGELF